MKSPGVFHPDKWWVMTWLESWLARDSEAAAVVQNCLLITVKAFLRICTEADADDTYPARTLVVAVDIAGLSTVSKSQHHRACCWKTRHRPRRAVVTSSALPTWWFGWRGSGMGSLSWAAQLGWSRAGTPPHSVQAVPAAAACGLVPSARVTQQPRWLCH